MVETNRQRKPGLGVTPGSSFSARAINARLSLLINDGRFADAERLINEAVQDPRTEPTAVRILLLPIFTQQDRLEDAERLVEERWQHLYETREGTSELAINLARLHIELVSMPNPTEAVRPEIERAAKMAPDDDRVWLGQANLATRTGDMDAGERWLDACYLRRPDDIPVWRARTRWAMAAGRIEVVRDGLSRLQAVEPTSAQVCHIEAWLAAKQADLAGEHQALDRLIASAPADLDALKRLAELARQDGNHARAAEFHRRQIEVERQTARYLKLYERNQPIRDAAEMGQLAERLGRSFEARVFLGLAAAESLNRDDAKRSLQSLRQHSAALAQTKGTLTAAVAAQRSAHAKEEGDRVRGTYTNRMKP